MIRFVEIINQTRFNPRMERTAVPQFSMGEVWINEKYVVSIREATGAPAHRSRPQSSLYHRGDE